MSSSSNSDSVSDDTEANKFCLNCNSRGDHLKLCARCKLVYFCNNECQLECHKEHYKTCNSSSDNNNNNNKMNTDENNNNNNDQSYLDKHLPKGMPKPKTEEQKRLEIEEETFRIEQKLLPTLKGSIDERAIDELENALVFAITNENEQLERKSRIALAQSYLNSNRAKEALHYLEPVIKYYKQEGTTEAVEAHIMAAECCVKDLATFNDNNDNYKMKELSLERMKTELAAALDAATEYTQKDEKVQAEVLVRCGICLLDAKLFDKAIGVFIQASACADKIKEHSISARAKNRVGYALIQLKRPSDAIIAWKDELESLDKFEDKKNESFLKSLCHGNIFAAYAFLGLENEAEMHGDLSVKFATKSGDINELKRSLLQQKTTWSVLNSDKNVAKIETQIEKLQI